MTDNTNEQARMYTEEEVFQLFQRFRAEEKIISQQTREERPLPLDIATYLEDSTPFQIQENFKRFKPDLSKYQDEEWTVGEEINKSLIPKLTNTVTQLTHPKLSLQFNKGSEETLRTYGRAATELYEQLSNIQEGEMSQDEARQLLAETVENAKHLAIFAWYQDKQQDDLANEYIIKALKLPTSLKHLETNSLERKKFLVSNSSNSIRSQLQYQQKIFQAATGGNNSNGGSGRGGYSNQWNLLEDEEFYEE